MKRIPIETADKTYYAKALTLAQLEEHDETINVIAEEGKALMSAEGARVPVSLLKAQAEIVLVAMRNHDAAATMETVKAFSLQEIVTAFGAVLSGTGYVEVPVGEPVPGEGK